MSKNNYMGKTDEDWIEWIDVGINSWISVDKKGNEYLNEEDIYNCKTHLSKIFREKITRMREAYEQGRMDVIREFTMGKICVSCGKSKPNNLTDHCDFCLENN